MCLLTGLILTIIACIELHGGSTIVGGLLLLVGCIDMCCGEYITVIDRKNKNEKDIKEDE